MRNSCISIFPNSQHSHILTGLRYSPLNCFATKSNGTKQEFVCCTENNKENALDKLKRKWCKQEEAQWSHPLVLIRQILDPILKPILFFSWRNPAAKVIDWMKNTNRDSLLCVKFRQILLFYWFKGAALISAPFLLPFTCIRWMRDHKESSVELVCMNLILYDFIWSHTLGDNSFICLFDSEFIQEDWPPLGQGTKNTNWMVNTVQMCDFNVSACFSVIINWDDKSSMDWCNIKKSIWFSFRLSIIGFFQ